MEAGEAALAALPDGAATIRGILEFNMGAVHLRLADTARARSHLEAGFDANLRSGTAYLVLASLAHLGYLASLTEGVGVARQRLEDVPAFAIVLYQLAQVHYLADELDEARPLLERAVELTRAERETDILANVRIHLARVAAGGGDIDAAEDHLAAATALAHGHNVKPFATSLDVERARLAEARSGRLQTPESAPPGVEPEGRWSSVREAEVVLQLQHLLKLGRRREADELAAVLRAESEARDRGPARCVARIAEAATKEDTAARHDALEAALSLAARHGYRRPILECGEPARAVIEAGLKAASLSDTERAFARDLLRRFPGRESGPAAEPAHPTMAPTDFHLTDREIETLTLLTRGLTNKAMAKELYVSVNTVKTHLKRIYAKLDVSTRTEAAHRARAMGLGDR